MKPDKSQIIKKQEILQAVILADDFTENLVPMNEYFPLVLTPVANTPLLDYIVETLIASKVQEIYLYCTNYVEDLKKRVNALQSTKNISISLMINEGCYSMGDAMRDIDSKGNIRGDFILVRGNSMINANLQNFVKSHRARMRNDKGAIMTVLMQNIGSKKNSSFQNDMYFIVSDEKTKRLTCYEKMSANEKFVLKRKNLIMSEKSKINTDLVDTHVYVCSPAVLSLFSDNFDFQTMDDFIKGIIINEEILDSRIYWESLDFRSWGLPLTSWNAYNVVCRDIIQRRFFPLVPETITFCKEYQVSVSQCFYKHHSAKTDRCNSVRNCIIGENSTVGKNSTIIDTVIGPNCKIGNNVTIANSYIISNVTIGNDVCIKGSIIFSNSSVLNKATLVKCIITESVNVSEQSTLENAIIRSKDNIVHSCTMNLSNQNNPKQDVIEVSNELDESDRLIRFMGYFSEEEVEDNEMLESSSDEEDDDESNEEEEEDLDNQIFMSEVSDSLLRGYQEKLNTDNLILEINSSRYAYNVKVNDVTRIVTKCILRLPVRYLEETNIEVNKMEYFKTLKGVVTFFEEILKKYNRSAVSEFQVLKAFEEVASSMELFLPVLKHVLHYFYEKDFLSENTILEWFEKYEENDGSEKLNMNIKTAVQAFVDWLREAGEDDSDSDNDD